MPLTRKIVHARMMQAIPLVFNSTVTIAVETPVQDPNSGEETIAYLPSPTMTDVPCYVEPQTQREIRRPDSTIVERPFTIALQGFYRLIDVEDQAIVTNDVGTQTHNILAVRHDDTATITFLDTEIIS